MESQLVPIANKLSRSQSRNFHSPHSPEKHSKIGGPGLSQGSKHGRRPLEAVRRTPPLPYT